MECSVFFCNDPVIMTTVVRPIGKESIRVDAAYCETHWPIYSKMLGAEKGLELVDTKPVNNHRKPWMNERIAEIDARWQNATPGPWKAAEQTHGEWVGIHDDYRALGSMVEPRDADPVAHAPEDVAYLLDALRHMFDSFKTGERAIDALDRVERRLQEMECGPEEGPHRKVCPGCSRADQIRAVIKGDE